MQSLLLVLSVAAVLEAALGCQSHPHPIRVGDCCKVDYKEVSSPVTEKKCLQDHFAVKPSPDQMDNATACFYDCYFAEQGLLTSDRKMARDALKAFWNALSSEDVRQLIMVNNEKCLELFGAGVESRVECNSGALEYSRCLKRAVVLDCPGDLWSATQECEANKAELAACPQAYVVMGKMKAEGLNQ